jgi:hypothetical protein
MVKKVKKGRKPEIHSDNEYIRARREEFMLCRTPGCRNAIAMWATGAASNGYCGACRKKRTHEH